VDNSGVWKRTARLARMAAWLLPVLVPSPALAAKTDVVVLKNGDHLTGEVSELDRGRLTFKTDDMGTLAIEWDKIRSVTATATFDVEDVQGHRYVGSLQPGPTGSELRIGSGEGAPTVALARVIRMRRIGATFWQRLNGSLDVGTSYNASQLFNFDAAGELSTERPGFGITANASSTISSQPGAEDTRRSTLSLAYERRFPDRWVALIRGQLEQNRELGFDLRSSAAAGGGRYLVQNARDSLLAGLGLSVNREKPTEGESITNVEALAFVAYDRFSYDFPNLDVSVGLRGFTSLSESGRHRLEVDAQLKRELVKDFYATLRGYDSYDSRPPTEGARRNDYGVTFALGWSF
jgi:hypothetical protein